MDAFFRKILLNYPDIEYISNVLVWKYVTNASFF